jgi:adenine-specific DNA-methyltransferase
MDDRRETLNGRIPWFSLHWARSKEFFEGEPRILSVRKCSKPTFTYVETDAYVQMAFNIIKSKRINLKYLVGLFNSKIVAFWLRNKGKMQGSMYQVDKEPLLSIPIIKTENDTEIVKIVDEIILNKKLSNDTADLEEKLDNLFYKLYQLTEDEINSINLALSSSES